ncbi:MAG: heavy-metal-associated domain-containing protein [Bacteroidetes bacterium]|nr:heavy-metal-associated domain-containing protein [Bacteroidota bacterium]
MFGGRTVYYPNEPRTYTQGEHMKHVTIDIEGMTCGHCVMSVRNELGRLEGVTIRSVKIGSAEVEVNETTVQDQMLQNAVAEAGYAVKAIH